MVDSNPGIIVVTGPESVGKTSLVKALVDNFGGSFIAEFARDYISQLNRAYNYQDIEHIARRQLKEYKQYSADLNDSMLFVDTHLIISKIWFKWHANKYPDWIDTEISRTQNALYLLCFPDIDWQADEVRENGGEARMTLYNEYKKELDHFELNYKVVYGTGVERIDRAIQYVDEYIQQKFENYQNS